MPVNVKELKLVYSGQAKGGSGTVVNKYMLTTADTAATVEANGYFDGILGNALNPGDIIEAVTSMSGTPVLKNYLVTVGGADVTVVSAFAAPA